jgi:hypothetical protein
VNWVRAKAATEPAAKPTALRFVAHEAETTAAEPTEATTSRVETIRCTAPTFAVTTSRP